MIKWLREKVKSIFKSAVLVAVEEGDVQQILKCKALGVDQRASHYSPSGLYSVPVSDSMVVLMSLQANDDNKIGFAWDPKNRPAGMSEGEVMLRNPKSNAQIYCKKNGEVEISTTGGTITVGKTGDISIEGTSVSVTAPSVSMSGNLTVAGALTTATAIIGGVPFATHKHPAGGTLLDSTGNPCTGATGGPTP